MADSVDVDEVAHFEPPHQDLRCLKIQLFSSLVLKELNWLSFQIYKYTHQQKKCENLLLFNRLKIKYVELEKYILHIKLTVYYTVSFPCNIHFLNSTYFIFYQFNCNKFSRFFGCWVYVE